MKLLICSDIDRELIPFFAETLTGKKFADITLEELEEIDLDKSSVINKNNEKYKQVQETAEKELKKIKSIFPC